MTNLEIYFILFYFIGLAFCVSSKAIDPISLEPADVDTYWEEFKNQHNRNYDNLNDAQRRKIFEENIKKINDLNELYNKGEILYTSGITGFSDFTTDEFFAFLKKGGVTSMNKPSNNDYDYEINITVNITSKLFPLEIDWRTKGYVNPIQSQGDCGSCWAFSSVAAIEGQYFKKYNELLKFSEQNLVDCVYDRDGCTGGMSPTAFKYLQNSDGIALSDDYPYVSGDTQTWNGDCMSTNKAALVRGYKIVSHGYANEAGVTQVLAQIGPLSAAFYSSSNSMHYTGGIFNDPLCYGISDTDINHAVALVGYGTEDEVDYYIVRNSWGPNWGEDGYMKIPRNMCNIANFVSYPIVESASTTPIVTTPIPTTIKTTTKATTKTTTKTTTRITTSRTTTFKTTTSRQTYSTVTTTKRTTRYTTSRPTTRTTFRQSTSTTRNYLDWILYYLALNHLNIPSVNNNLFIKYPFGQIVSINLDNNLIQMLLQNTFCKFPRLNELSLNGNMIYQLEPGWATGLSNLKRLALNNNRIISLDNNVLSDLTNLEELYMSGNGFKFTDETNSPFSDLTNLRRLDLSNNNLANTITSNSFINLNKLKELNLRNSNINIFSSDAFRVPFCSPQISNTVISIANNPVMYNIFLVRNNMCYSFGF